MKIKCVGKSLLHFNRFCLFYEGHSLTKFMGNAGLMTDGKLEVWASQDF